jgi:hypothetical protein
MKRHDLSIKKYNKNTVVDYAWYKFCMQEAKVKYNAVL